MSVIQWGGSNHSMTPVTMASGAYQVCACVLVRFIKHCCMRLRTCIVYTLWHQPHSLARNCQHFIAWAQGCKQSCCNGMRATHELDANQGCLCSHDRCHDLMQECREQGARQHISSQLNSRSCQCH